MEEHLTTFKNICDKCVTLINKNSEIYGPSCTRQLSANFDKALIIKLLGERVTPLHHQLQKHNVNHTICYFWMNWNSMAIKIEKYIIPGKEVWYWCLLRCNIYYYYLVHELWTRIFTGRGLLCKNINRQYTVKSQEISLSFNFFNTHTAPPLEKAFHYWKALITGFGT